MLYRPRCSLFCTSRVLFAWLMLSVFDLKSFSKLFYTSYSSVNSKMEKFTILPEKVLNQQFCTECWNYLSVGPVMVSREGDIICGRCSQRMDSEYQLSLYNLIAENLMFKCINYYVGCRKLLRFNKALKHEEQCKRNMTNCLTCPFCNYEGNGCQLISHFDNNHTYSVAEHNFKVINEDNFLENVVFIKNGCIFCVTIFVGRDNKVYIYNLRVASDNTVVFSDFKLKFFDLESNVETPPIRVNLECKRFPSNSDLNSAVDINANYPCSLIFAQAMLTDCFPSRSCSCKIELIDKNKVPEDGYFNTIIEEVDRNISEIRVAKSNRVVDFYIDYILNMPTPDLIKFVSSKLCAKQRCVNCKEYVTTPAYFCPKYHMACGKCTTKKCSNCKAYCQWDCKSRLHNISLQCEWSGCTVHTDIFDFLRHKRDCEFRRYECPGKNCNFIGSLSSLKEHWHLNPLNEDDRIYVWRDKGGHYWLHPVVKDLFYLTCDEISFGQLLVGINKVNATMYESYNFMFHNVHCKVINSIVFHGEKSGNFVQYLFCIYDDTTVYLTLK